MTLQWKSIEVHRKVSFSATKKKQKKKKTQTKQNKTKPNGLEFLLFQCSVRKTAHVFRPICH